MATPFGTSFYDSDGVAITGSAANTAIKFRRAADGYYLDHADGTFKASGWTTLETTMTEVDATNDPGYYEFSQDVSTWDDGWYQVSIDHDDGTDVIHARRDFYVKDGEAW